MAAAPSASDRSSPPARPGDAADLRARADRAAALVHDCEGPLRVVSHYDADGLASAGVLAHALRRADKAFTLSIARRFDADVVRRAATADADLLVFADMGTGEASRFADAGVADRTVVLDHHVPEQGLADPDAAGRAEGREGGLAAHVSAHLAGIDGTYAACAASVSFLFATRLDEANWDLLPCALAGVVGDRQARLGVHGLNGELVAEGEKRSVVRVETAPRLPPGPLAAALAASTDPFLLGLTGDEEAARAWLAGAVDVDPDATWDALDEPARRRLVSRLAARLLGQGVRPAMARELVGPRFRSTFRGVDDAEALADLLNAAGRFDHVGEGLAFLLGDDDARAVLERARDGYHRRVLEETLRVAGEGATPRRAVQVVRVEEPTLTGTVASVAMNCFLDQERATVALHRDDGTVKASARGTRYLIGKGLDLAEACRKAAGEAGGSGGGHTIAAGADVPHANAERFLAALDEVVAGQIGPADGASAGEGGEDGGADDDGEAGEEGEADEDGEAGEEGKAQRED